MDNENINIIGEVDLTTPREILLDKIYAEAGLNINLGNKGKNKAGKCRIVVYGNEGPIPHFHIESISNLKFYCCIRIYECRYFHHKYNEVNLNSDQKFLLDEFLNEINNQFNISNWEFIKRTWHQANPNLNFKKYCDDNNIDVNNIKKPDYLHLQDEPIKTN